MSLTQLIRKREVSALFKELTVERFKPPAMQILAPPVTENYQLVGMAFDYLLRFYIKRLNPDALGKLWIDDNSWNLLTHGSSEKLFATLTQKQFCELQILVDECLEDARVYCRAYLRTGLITDDLLAATLRLATLEVAYRAGSDRVDWTSLNNIDQGDIEDLKSLIALVDPSVFKSTSNCFLNPHFNLAGFMVGGADADVIIDSRIIDIKTTKSITLDKRDIYQVIGYYVLAILDGVSADERRKKIDWRKRYPDQFKMVERMEKWEKKQTAPPAYYTDSVSQITTLSLYYSRCGYMHNIPVSELWSTGSVEDFVAEFVRLASPDKNAGVCWWKEFNGVFAKAKRDAIKQGRSIRNKSKEQPCQ